MQGWFYGCSYRGFYGQFNVFIVLKLFEKGVLYFDFVQGFINYVEEVIKGEGVIQVGSFNFKLYMGLEVCDFCEMV